MICKSCMKNVASVKFTEAVDGKGVQHLLCPECYKAQQETSTGFSLSVPKPAVHGFGREKPDTPARTKAIAKCPACNTTLSQVLESATVGCATCYVTFGTEVESMLEALHRGSAHRGKTFKCDKDRLQVRKDIQAKRILLRRMIKEENYEEAARLRDEIMELEAGPQSPATTG